MIKLKEYIKDNRKEVTLFLMFALMCFFQLLLCDFRYDDDAFLYNIEELGLVQKYISTTHFGGWSSRFITEFVLYFLVSKLPMFIWAIITTCIDIALLAILLYVFKVNINKHNIVIICATLFAFPWSIQSTAGWMATTLNCWWPVCFGMISLGIMIKHIYNEENRPFMLIIGLMSAIYGADVECSCVFLFVACSVVFVCAFFNHQKKLYASSIGILTALRLLLHIYWNSHGCRVPIETERWFPDFANLSIIQKAQIGFSSTCYNIFEILPLPLFLLCLSLCVLIYIKYKDSLFKRAVAAIPFLIVIYEGFLVEPLTKKFPQLAFLESTYDDLYGVVSIAPYPYYVRFLKVGIWGIALACIIACIFWVVHDIEKSLLLTGFLGAGFLSRFILGFSPTQFASSTRTNAIVCLTIIICAAYFFLKIIEEESKLCNILLPSVVFIGGISYILTVIFTIYLIGLPASYRTWFSLP